MSDSNTPLFAVVGHPNKGKSSIVAALTQQDKVAISELSGTTTAAQTFHLTIDGQIQYGLIDTPGFQRPRQMLEVLEALAPNASERRQAIQQFINNHQAEAIVSSRFHDEIELLTPILAGANIIYVVDGSVAYTPEYEAEMTILQWTGQARMALINPINGEEFVAQWQQALGQYFSLVRVYNPMTANKEQQYGILSAFEELNPAWRQTLDAVKTTIQHYDAQQHSQSAQLIAEYLAECLTYNCGAPEPTEALRPALEKSLQIQYEKHIKDRETELKNNLKTLYVHEQLQTQADELAINTPDLFDQGQWYIFGLSRQKLVALAASGGAAAGAVIDIGLGGASLLAGSLIGGISSAAASLYFTESPEKIRIKNMPLGGKKMLIGPIKNLQFAFVLLGRAVSFYQAICNHSHANRSQVIIAENNHWLDRLEKRQQIQLTHLLQKGHKGFSNKEHKQFFELVSHIIESAK